MTTHRSFLVKLTAILCLITAVALKTAAADIHVTTTGNDSNAGTEAAPLLTIHKAVEMVRAGDRILIHEGTYIISERIKIPELPTTAEQRCEMRAWPESAVGKVIIDGSAMNHTTESAFKMGRCIYVNHLANYWTFYGLVLQNAEDNGMKIEGSYNRVERCVFRWNNDTGLQIGMYKDFSIEETKSLPISGQPQYNPGYTYCRGNKVINCDSYENADLRTYNGKDDGGDADGFACKLFPGPGTEFHGCRAWTNSDDNWDLYMVYHPVVIDHCWAWHAGYLKNGSQGKNGNGFKLGGGGSAGGAAFDQSVGAHVVTNCVAFENLHKGFDQNNAYEGMYIINCTAWGNEYNYRFPTLFKYGTMTIRNCIGWGATAQKSGVAVGNHEFLSPDKDGYREPDTDFNSWTTLDGCSPIKEGYKEGKTQTVTKEHGRYDSRCQRTGRRTELHARRTDHHHQRHTTEKLRLHADGTKGSKTTEKMKKQTLLSWNVLEQAGISDGQQLRSLELLNNSTSGGARIYDVYIRVPDNSTVTAIANRKQLTKREQAASASVVTKRFTADGIVIEKNGVSYSVTGQVRSATKD